ncbi:ArsR/SmtB family transcription factor [Amycolatopsis lurida]
MAEPIRGEPDIAAVAALFADTRRARVLLALADGRALPAGRLAQEAGVAASTASNHLGILLDRGLVTVLKQGRHRYYRLATPQVEKILEALAGLAPRKPITSLREHTRARAVRTGRTCYHHLAGRAGVRLFADLIECGWLEGGDGRHDPDSAVDRLSAPGRGNQYRLTATGAAALGAHGIADHLLSTTRPVRYCVDWTEQAHHLAGPLGRAITDRLFDLGAISRGTVPRSVVIGDDRFSKLFRRRIPAIHQS